MAEDLPLGSWAGRVVYDLLSELNPWRASVIVIDETGVGYVSCHSRREPFKLMDLLGNVEHYVDCARRFWRRPIEVAVLPFDVPFHSTIAESVAWAQQPKVLAYKCASVLKDGTVIWHQMAEETWRTSCPSNS